MLIWHLLLIQTEPHSSLLFGSDAPYTGCSVIYTLVQLRTLQYSSVEYSTLQYSTLQYSTLQYSTLQYSALQQTAMDEPREEVAASRSLLLRWSWSLTTTVQYSTVQYSTLQYS